MKIEVTIGRDGMLCISVAPKGMKLKAVTPQLGHAYNIVWNARTHEYGLQRASNEPELELIQQRVVFDVDETWQKRGGR